MKNQSVVWQDIAWNAVRLQIPADWQPAVILTNHLVFEYDFRPVFELKWRKIKGNFSLQRQLKRLTKDIDKQAEAELLPRQIPQRWEDALKEYLVTGFSWQAAQGSGRGIILFCKQCNLATLLQFHGSLADNEFLTAEILRSYHDHSPDQFQYVAMYDIQARLPLESTLISHSFEAGRYVLTFELEKQTITLFRFKPAATLLKKHTLVSLGSSLAGKGAILQTDNSSLAEWYTAPSTKNLSFKKIFRKQPSRQFLRLWHVVENNAILGVQFQGSHGFKEETMKYIWNNFLCESQ